jgi:hypothetical protein
MTIREHRDSLWRIDPYLFQIRRGDEVLLSLKLFRYEVDPLSGQDLTGDGAPEFIVKEYSGGAHCCHSTIFCSLGDELEVLYLEDSPCGNVAGRFIDLNGDGVYEFVTSDDSFAYRYCCYACSPPVLVVMKYVPGTGFVPASPEFADLYEEEIREHTALAEWALTRWQAGGISFETYRCGILALVLDYLYSGRIAQGGRPWRSTTPTLTLRTSGWTSRAWYSPAGSLHPLNVRLRHDAPWNAVGLGTRTKTNWRGPAVADRVLRSPRPIARPLRLRAGPGDRTARPAPYRMGHVLPGDQAAGRWKG